MSGAGGRVKVWDPWVRIGHWLLVAGFFLAYLTGEDPLAVHVWAGYGVAAIVVLRIIWGLVGPSHARFASFAYSPRRVFSYLGALFTRRAPRYLAFGSIQPSHQATISSANNRSDRLTRIVSARAILFESPVPRTKCRSAEPRLSTIASRQARMRKRATALYSQYTKMNRPSHTTSTKCQYHATPSNAK